MEQPVFIQTATGAPYTPLTHPCINRTSQILLQHIVSPVQPAQPIKMDFFIARLPQNWVLYESLGLSGYFVKWAQVERKQHSNSFQI